LPAVADFDGIKANIQSLGVGNEEAEALAMHARRRFREYEYGPWPHPFEAFACCFGGTPWRMPSRRQETQALKDYIADLKEELEDAEERLREMEKSPER
jgi:hypothetical protein